MNDKKISYCIISLHCSCRLAFDDIAITILSLVFTATFKTNMVFVHNFQIEDFEIIFLIINCKKEFICI